MSAAADDPLDADFDIELRLLIDAVYLKYHYDFRGYAQASLRRRLLTAMTRFDCATLSQLQDRLLHEPAVFPQLLDYLTVQVSATSWAMPAFRQCRTMSCTIPRRCRACSTI